VANERNVAFINDETVINRVTRLVLRSCDAAHFARTTMMIVFGDDDDNDDMHVVMMMTERVSIVERGGGLPHHILPAKAALHTRAAICQ